MGRSPLLDFGVAKSGGLQPGFNGAPDTSKASNAYMSPEQVEAGPASNRRSDVFPRSASCCGSRSRGAALVFEGSGTSDTLRATSPPLKCRRSRRSIRNRRAGASRRSSHARPSSPIEGSAYQTAKAMGNRRLELSLAPRGAHRTRRYLERHEDRLPPTRSIPRSRKVHNTQGPKRSASSPRPNAPFRAKSKSRTRRTARSPEVGLPRARMEQASSRSSPNLMVKASQKPRDASP